MPGSSPPTRVHEAREAIALLPARRLGSLLRARRKEAHVAAIPAARAARIEISTLDEIESGRTTPAATVLAALLDCYGVTPGEFVPRRVPLAITSSDATSGETLRGYVDDVRKWRKAGHKQKLNFRQSDVLALSEALGTDPDEIERRLIAITGCSPLEARLLRKWFLAALVTIPVASGLLGGIVPTAAGATLAHSPSTANSASITTVAQGTLTPGALSISVAAPELGAVRPDGIIPLTVGYVITDARGSGAGWSAQATFTSTDATAYPTSETLRNVNGAANLPQTPALPTALGNTPVVIVHAAPGPEGMGSFAGQLDLDIIGQNAHSSGQLTLTFAAPASA
jgi:transcriptional regulator with XRE-family HTH domain